MERDRTDESDHPQAEAPGTNPFDFFDHIFCLNLDSERERWRAMVRRFRALGIADRVERFPAIPTPDNHHRGCALSWRRMIAEAARQRYARILVCEDDAIFLDHTLAIMRPAIADLARQEWDLCYLGAAVWSQEFPFVAGSTVLQECGPVTAGPALAIDRRAYARILADLPPGEAAFDRWLDETLAIDQYFYREVAAGTFRALITAPRVASQPMLLNYDNADRALAHRYVLADGDPEEDESLTIDTPPADVSESIGAATGTPQATRRAPDGPKGEGTVALTIGMATYKDFDGVYFTLQALRLYQDLRDTELLVIDNYGCEDTRQFVEDWGGARYILATDAVGTAAPRDQVFREAQSEAVLCCDSHVLFVPDAIARLKAYYRAHPDSRDLIQGPLVYDDLHTFSTHMDPVWREHFWGTWATDPRGANPEGEAFDIPMQGLGIFSCRKAVWPGFNPRFRGFGGEEGYIHEKFRQAGGRCLCLPGLRWMHRFGRPSGVPYPLTTDDKLRNYLIGHGELGLDPVPVIQHFAGSLAEQTIVAIALEALWDAPPDAAACASDVLPQRPTRHPAVIAKPLADGSLTLFHPVRREFITLNPLAAFLWESSTGQETIDALIGEVRSAYPEQEGVDRDVLAVLQGLAEKRFITLAGAPMPP